MRALIVTAADMPENQSFVSIGSDAWPGGYRPYIVTGTGPQLAALAADPDYLVGQEIRYVDDALLNEQLAENFTLGQFNAFITARGREAVTSANPIGEAIAQDMTVTEAIEWWLLAEGYSQGEADALIAAMDALNPTPATYAEAFQQIMIGEGYEQSALDPITGIVTNVRRALEWWLENEGFSYSYRGWLIQEMIALTRPVMTQEQAFRQTMAGEGYSSGDLDTAVTAIWQRAQPIQRLINNYLEANDFETLPDVGDGLVQNWRDARVKAIAPGALTTINTWLTNNGHDPMTAENSVLDLVRVFVPGYVLGRDNVHDTAA